MSYTSETYSRFNQRVEESRNVVSRHIQYLLKPDDDYPKGSDARLKELYDTWRAECRAMDAACEQVMHIGARHEMIEMPPNDPDHFLCRQMAAVIIERYIFGEYNAQHYLPALIEKLLASECWKHSRVCACHFHMGDSGWTYENNALVNTLSAHYLKKERDLQNEVPPAEPSLSVSAGGGSLSYQPAMGGGSMSGSTKWPVRVACGGWRDCSCGGCSGGGGAPPELPSKHDIETCACCSCYAEREKNGTEDAYMAKLRLETDKVLSKYREKPVLTNLLNAAAMADDAISAARKMPGGSTDTGFARNLFQTVQGVNYDDKCPHGLPFYACMPCSH